MNIAFIGAGNVGAPLAARLASAGHSVVIATDDPSSNSTVRALARSSALRALPTDAALAEAEVVFLAVPFSAHASLLPPLANVLADRIVVDCTNPVGPGLSHGLRSERSGSQLVQDLLPASRVVKAFSIYGFENFDDPSYPAYAVRPAMLFCGNDPAARARVAGLIDACGFEPLDVGALDQALHLEHMTLLWVRMVRASGASPGLVWAALRR